jgi:transposase
MTGDCHVRFCEKLRGNPRLTRPPMQVLNEPGKKATQLSYMWLVCSSTFSKPAVFFQYETNRSSKSAENLLENFSGVLHTDAYTSYNAVVARNSIESVGCWAHARRNYFEAEKDGAKEGKSTATWFLEEIGKLFALEQNFKGLSPEIRLQQRNLLSKPIIDSMFSKLEYSIGNSPPKSKLGKAHAYLRNDWHRLTQILKFGEAELSNNIAENHIRPFAIGRKNWLFAATPRGAEASSIFYSILSTAKINNLCVHKYLLKLLSEIPKLQAETGTFPNMEPFLPWNCADCVLTPK